MVVPTLVIKGKEEEKIRKDLEQFMNKFKKITISSPLLTSYEDYHKLIEAMKQEMPVAKEGKAIVLMGHGTHHGGNSAYRTLDFTFKDEGYDNVFVGTVEGLPTFKTVLKNLKKRKYKKITLIPAMMVAGNHAQKDMAGDEKDSWKNLLKTEGFDVECILQGLGELSSIQNLFVEHAKEALDERYKRKEIK